MNIQIKSVDASKEAALFCTQGRQGGRLSEGVQKKTNWLAASNETKAVIIEVDGSRAGFMEYSTIETSIRNVEGHQYLFIHCFWINSKYQKQGMGSRLLHHCIEDARTLGLYGVATLCSSRAWLTESDFFLRRGFAVVEERKPFQLLVYSLVNDAPLPKISEPRPLPNMVDREVTAVYLHQCPFIAAKVNGLQVLCQEKRMEIPGYTNHKKRGYSPVWQCIRGIWLIRGRSARQLAAIECRPA